MGFSSLHRIPPRNLLLFAFVFTILRHKQQRLYKTDKNQYTKGRAQKKASATNSKMGKLNKSESPGLLHMCIVDDCDCSSASVTVSPGFPQELTFQGAPVRCQLDNVPRVH